MNKELLRMQKLAGLITESELNEKIDNYEDDDFEDFSETITSNEKAEESIKKWIGGPTGKNWELIKKNFKRGLRELLKQYTEDSFSIKQVMSMSSNIEDDIKKEASEKPDSEPIDIYAKELAPYVYHVIHDT